MKIKLFIILVCVEIVSIAILGFKIKQKKSVLGVSMPIHGDTSSMKKFESNKLRYFYEPLPNFENVQENPWSHAIPHIKTNSDTLNNLSDIPWGEKGKLKIVALGDSFTYGQYVDTDKNWVNKLERHLNQSFERALTIVNLGVEGYDIEYSVERFRLRGEKYNPRLIIWFLKNDDFISIADQLAPLVQINRPLDRVVGEGDRAIYIADAVNKMIKDMGGMKHLLSYQMERLRSLRQYYSGPILIMYLDLADEQLQVLNDWGKQDKNVHLFGLPDIRPDKSYYFPDFHPTEKGHDLIEQALYRYLDAHRMLLN